MAPLIKIEWPESRENLINDLKILSDLDYQKKVWCADGHPYGVMSNLDFIWNEPPIGRPVTDIPKYIGLILYTEKEADALIPLCTVLDKINNEIGGEERNEKYLSSPLWDDLLKSAKVAYDVLTKGDQEALLGGKQIRT